MTAFTQHASMHIGERLADLAKPHAGNSGFAILRHGQPAFAARIALADIAERSLDLQYYIWEADPTGRLLADRVVRAAERGVRVRVLLDDINLAGRDEPIAALDAHPNIDIRIFNPFANRKLRALGFISDMARINHRMHNKIMVMDDAIALVGGRNIGAHYFEAHDESNFRDLDIVCVGPVVRETSNVFDRFWSGPWSVPISELTREPHGEADSRAAVEELRRLIGADRYSFPIGEGTEALLARLESIFDDMVWAPGAIVWDDPAAVFDAAQPGRMNEALYTRMRALKSELLIETAYFVPRDKGLAAAKLLVDRGVRVRVLTNSLASNDVLAAHAGYSRYREPLLEAGVDLYELRPYPGPISPRIVSAGAHAGLHTKAVVFDRTHVFIGSFNLDPRSASVNTEAGIYVESAELARQVVAYLDEGVAPENAYRVVAGDRGKLHWLIEIDGERADYDKDPGSTWYQRWLVAVIRLLPVEGQL